MKLLHLLKEAALAVFDNVFYFLSFFIPKEKNIWAFGSMFGREYADNSKYFFEHICEHHSDIRAIWFSDNPAVVVLLRDQGREAYRFYDVKGILLAMRARVGFISHSNVRDIRPFIFTPATLLVNLWHGIPLKKIALDDNVFEVRNKSYFRIFNWLSQLLCPGFRRQPDLLTAASSEDQGNFCTAFNIPITKIKITGYPRNDALFRNRDTRSNGLAVKKGLYAPTFRGKENTNFDFFVQFGFDARRVDRFLSRLNVQLYLKLHHFNFPSDHIRNLIESTENVLFYEGVDIYGDLNKFDFLITDFSSIYFDYLLLERPIIFAAFDSAGFERSVRQLYYDYSAVTPGPKVHNWPELMDAIARVLKCPEEFSAELGAMRKKFHRYADDKSSERVYAEVVKSF